MDDGTSLPVSFPPSPTIASTIATSSSLNKAVEESAGDTCKAEIRAIISWTNVAVSDSDDTESTEVYIYVGNH